MSWAIILTYLCSLLISAIAFWWLVGDKPAVWCKWASLSLIPMLVLLSWSVW